ncbi:MAG: 2-oxoacid:acceptor oxidoreductase subunit alpha [Patescibacteria group bacterium]
MMDSITWKIGGEAGFGIISAGVMLSRTFARAGYHVFATNDYPSLIRGGHNVVTVRIGQEQFESMNRDVHILVALNAETVELHKEELSQEGVVLYDPRDKEWQEADFPRPVKLLPVPFKELMSSVSADPVMRNTVALGVTVALLGASFEILANVIRDQFKRKGEEVINLNLKIAQLGYDHVKKMYASETSLFLAPGKRPEKLLVMNGSEAVGLGAVRAGLKFAAIYPMTPINALITFLADHAKDFGIVYKQPEDEIAGINMAIGAAIGGVRSMVATSGGGFALMVEGLSFAGVVEAPLVIDLGMRVGPATGMPTYTEQGELQFVIHAGHGEFPRIVLAPGDAQEAYSLTVEAFNLAERYQVPVFLLTDKYLNESVWCVPLSHFQKAVAIDRGKLIISDTGVNSKEFKRYQLDSSGISPRSVPGTKGGLYHADSYEHDEVGHVTEDANMRRSQAAKRLKKFETMKVDIKSPTLYGEDTPEITFVSWGSTKGAILEALKMLATRGKKAKLVHFSWLYPFPSEEAARLLGSVTRLVDVEQNATAQLASLIREHTGILIKEKLLKFNGRPFEPEEIVEQVMSNK